MKFVGDGLSKEAKTCEISSKETVFSGSISADNVMLPKKDTDLRDRMNAQPGQIIYNTTVNKAQVYDGTQWRNLW